MRNGPTQNRVRQYSFIRRGVSSEANSPSCTRCRSSTLTALCLLARATPTALSRLWASANLASPKNTTVSCRTNGWSPRFRATVRSAPGRREVRLTTTTWGGLSSGSVRTIHRCGSELCVGWRRKVSPAEMGISYREKSLSAWARAESSSSISAASIAVFPPRIKISW